MQVELNHLLPLCGIQIGDIADEFQGVGASVPSILRAFLVLDNDAVACEKLPRSGRRFSPRPRIKPVDTRHIQFSFTNRSNSISLEWRGGGPEETMLRK